MSASFLIGFAPSLYRVANVSGFIGAPLGGCYRIIARREWAANRAVTFARAELSKD
ncbi:hypothetical protein [Serratia quinivorans]|uniref:hypothetical protein n=1 Tax=Serratia quinivorans TaxID=137545 RepID=UPI0021BDC847|nr:hypothetical protein [Serratia quinivorans]